MNPSQEPPNENDPSAAPPLWVLMLALVIRLLTPRWLSRNGERRWARTVAYSIAFLGATLYGVLAAGGVAVSLVPDHANWLKWPGIIALFLMGWGFVHFLPQVWQNRHDDKFAIGFVVLIIALCAWAILDAMMAS